MKALHTMMESAERVLAERAARSAKRTGAKRAFQRVALQSSRARADGLVKAAYLAVSREARLVQLHLPGVAPDVEAKRGECEGMSEDSQRRLLKMLHTIRRDAALPVMMTLTFPAEITLTPDEAKECRKAFEKRMIREHGEKWCCVWRMEAHPEMSRRLGRVHPHFHLLTWGAWYDLKEVSRAWNEVVWKVLDIDKGMADVRAKHLAAGTNCERVRKWAGVVYCAKTYLAKAEEYPIGKAGRVWGWSNRDALPLARIEIIDLTQAQAVAVRMEVESWMVEQRIQSEHLICSFYPEDPSMFVARLMRRFQPLPF